VQYPAVPGAHPDPPAVPGAHPDPPAVPGAHSDPQAAHVSGQDNSSTAAPTGGTNAELPSGTAREEANPSRAESTRNPNSASADITVGKTLLYIASMLCQGGCSFDMDDNNCFLGMDTIEKRYFGQHDLYKAVTQD